MERGLVLVLILVSRPRRRTFLVRFFSNNRGRRRGRNIKALDQFRQHRSDPQEQLFAFIGVSAAANALCNQRIQTRCAFSRRTTRVIEKLCSCSSLASAVSLGRIEQSGETGSIKLIRNFCNSSIRRSLLDVHEERRHPRDKTKL